MYNNALLGAGDAMSLRKAAEQALEALERCEYGVISNGRLKNSIKTLRQALAQPEWVGLTDQEKQFFRGMGFVGVEFVEAKLKEKNND